MKVLTNLSNILRGIDRKLTVAEEAAVAALLFAMTIIIFLAVIERFVIQTGITWLEELSRYLSVWGAFIGTSLAAKKGAHIGIEAFVQILPKRAREFEVLIVYLLGLTFSLIVLIVGIKFLGRLVETNQLSPAMRISMVWAYAAVPTGCGLMGVHYLIKFVVGLTEYLSPDGGEGRA